MQMNENEIKKFQSGIQSVKSRKNSKNAQEFGNLGFILYADMLENVKKREKESEKENQRLKIILKNMYKQTEKKLNSQSQNHNDKNDNIKYINIVSKQIQNQKKLIKSDQQIDWFSLNANDTIKSRKKIAYGNKDDLQAQSSSAYHANQIQSHMDQTKTQSMSKSFEIFSTFSTKSSFNMTNRRKNLQRKDYEYNQLNLWLFDDKNEKLQKELYEKGKQQAETNGLNIELKKRKERLQMYIKRSNHQLQQSTIQKRKSLNINLSVLQSIKERQIQKEKDRNPSHRYGQSFHKNSENLNIIQCVNNNKTQRSRHQVQNSQKTNKIKSLSKQINKDLFSVNKAMNSSKSMNKRNKFTKGSVLPVINNIAVLNKK